MLGISLVNMKTPSGKRKEKKKNNRCPKGRAKERETESGASGARDGKKKQQTVETFQHSTGFPFYPLHFAFLERTQSLKTYILTKECISLLCEPEIYIGDGLVGKGQDDFVGQREQAC